MSSYPQLTLSAVSARDLLEQLQTIDIAVPLLSDRRGPRYGERYMMARFLATMANAGRLEFPIRIVHDNKPDFKVSLAGLERGVECVEAVPPEYRKIEDIREGRKGHYPDAMNFGQKFTPGQQTFTVEELHEIASGGRSGHPWMPATMKRNWISAMEHVIAGKTIKLRSGNYSPNASTWLLVQDEWPNALHFYPERVRAAAVELLVRLEPLLSPPAFQSVFIASGEQLLCFQRGCLGVEKVCNLWHLPPILRPRDGQ